MVSLLLLKRGALRSVRVSDGGFAGAAFERVCPGEVEAQPRD